MTEWLRSDRGPHNRALAVTLVSSQLNAMVSMIPEDHDEAVEVIQKMHRHFARKLVRRVDGAAFGLHFSLPDTYFKSGQGRAILMDTIPVIEKLLWLEEWVETLPGGHYDENDRWVPNPELSKHADEIDALRVELNVLATKVVEKGFKR